MSDYDSHSRTSDIPFDAFSIINTVVTILKPYIEKAQQIGINIYSSRDSEISFSPEANKNDHHYKKTINDELRTLGTTAPTLADVTATARFTGFKKSSLTKSSELKLINDNISGSSSPQIISSVDDIDFAEKYLRGGENVSYMMSLLKRNLEDKDMESCGKLKQMVNIKNVFDNWSILSKILPLAHMKQSFATLPNANHEGMGYSDVNRANFLASSSHRVSFSLREPTDVFQSLIDSVSQRRAAHSQKSCIFSNNGMPLKEFTSLFAFKLCPSYPRGVEEWAMHEVDPHCTELVTWRQFSDFLIAHQSRRSYDMQVLTAVFPGSSLQKAGALAAKENVSKRLTVMDVCGVNSSEIQQQQSRALKNGSVKTSEQQNTAKSFSLGTFDPTQAVSTALVPQSESLTKYVTVPVNFSAKPPGYYVLNFQVLYYYNPRLFSAEMRLRTFLGDVMGSSISSFFEEDRVNCNFNTSQRQNLKKKRFSRYVRSDAHNAPILYYNYIAMCSDGCVRSFNPMTHKPQFIIFYQDDFNRNPYGVVLEDVTSSPETDIKGSLSTSFSQQRLDVSARKIDLSSKALAEKMKSDEVTTLAGASASPGIPRMKPLSPRAILPSPTGSSPNIGREPVEGCGKQEGLPKRRQNAPESSSATLSFPPGSGKGTSFVPKKGCAARPLIAFNPDKGHVWIVENGNTIFVCDVHYKHACTRASNIMKAFVIQPNGAVARRRYIRKTVPFNAAKMEEPLGGVRKLGTPEAVSVEIELVNMKPPAMLATLNVASADRFSAKVSSRSPRDKPSTPSAISHGSAFPRSSPNVRSFSTRPVSSFTPHTSPYASTALAVSRRAPFFITAIHPELVVRRHVKPYFTHSQHQLEYEARQRKQMEQDERSVFSSDDDDEENGETWEKRGATFLERAGGVDFFAGSMFLSSRATSPKREGEDDGGRTARLAKSLDELEYLKKMNKIRNMGRKGADVLSPITLAGPVRDPHFFCGFDNGVLAWYTPQMLGTTNVMPIQEWRPHRDAITKLYHNRDFYDSFLFGLISSSLDGTIAVTDLDKMIIKMRFEFCPDSSFWSSGTEGVDGLTGGNFLSQKKKKNFRNEGGSFSFDLNPNYLNCCRDDEFGAPRVSITSGRSTIRDFSNYRTSGHKLRSVLYFDCTAACHDDSFHLGNPSSSPFSSLDPRSSTNNLAFRASLLAAAGAGCYVCLYCGQTQHNIATFSDHNTNIIGVQFNNKLQQLLTLSADSVMHIYDLRTYKLIQKINCNEERTYRDDPMKALLVDSKSNDAIALSGIPYAFEPFMGVKALFMEGEPVSFSSAVIVKGNMYQGDVIDDKNIRCSDKRMFLCNHPKSSSFPSPLSVLRHCEGAFCPLLLVVKLNKLIGYNPENGRKLFCYHAGIALQRNPHIGFNGDETKGSRAAHMRKIFQVTKVREKGSDAASKNFVCMSDIIDGNDDFNNSKFNDGGFSAQNQQKSSSFINANNNAYYSDSNCTCDENSARIDSIFKGNPMHQKSAYRSILDIAHDPQWKYIFLLVLTNSTAQKIAQECEKLHLKGFMKPVATGGNDDEGRGLFSSEGGRVALSGRISRERREIDGRVSETDNADTFITAPKDETQKADEHRVVSETEREARDGNDKYGKHIEVIIRGKAHTHKIFNVEQYELTCIAYWEGSLRNNALATQECEPKRREKRRTIHREASLDTTPVINDIPFNQKHVHEGLNISCSENLDNKLQQKKLLFSTNTAAARRKVSFFRNDNSTCKQTSNFDMSATPRNASVDEIVSSSLAYEFATTKPAVLDQFLIGGNTLGIFFFRIENLTGSSSDGDVREDFLQVSHMIPLRHFAAIDVSKRLQNQLGNRMSPLRSSPKVDVAEGKKKGRKYEGLLGAVTCLVTSCSENYNVLLTGQLTSSDISNNLVIAGTSSGEVCGLILRGQQPVFAFFFTQMHYFYYFRSSAYFFTSDFSFSNVRSNDPIKEEYLDRDFVGMLPRMALQQCTTNSHSNTDRQDSSLLTLGSGGSSCGNFLKTKSNVDIGGSTILSGTAMINNDSKEDKKEGISVLKNRVASQKSHAHARNLWSHAASLLLEKSHALGDSIFDQFRYDIQYKQLRQVDTLSVLVVNRDDLAHIPPENSETMLARGRESLPLHTVAIDVIVNGVCYYKQDGMLIPKGYSFNRGGGTDNVGRAGSSFFSAEKKGENEYFLPRPSQFESSSIVDSLGSTTTVGVSMNASGQSVPATARDPGGHHSTCVNGIVYMVITLGGGQVIVASVDTAATAAARNKKRIHTTNVVTNALMKEIAKPMEIATTESTKKDQKKEPAAADVAASIWFPYVNILSYIPASFSTGTAAVTAVTSVFAPVIINSTLDAGEVACIDNEKKNKGEESFFEGSPQKLQRGSLTFNSQLLSNSFTMEREPVVTQTGMNSGLWREPLGKDELLTNEVSPLKKKLEVVKQDDSSVPVVTGFRNVVCFEKSLLFVCGDDTGHLSIFTYRLPAVPSKEALKRSDPSSFFSFSVEDLNDQQQRHIKDTVQKVSNTQTFYYQDSRHHEKHFAGLHSHVIRSLNQVIRGNKRINMEVAKMIEAIHIQRKCTSHCLMKSKLATEGEAGKAGLGSYQQQHRSVQGRGNFLRESQHWKNQEVVQRDAICKKLEEANKASNDTLENLVNKVISKNDRSSLQLERVLLFQYGITSVHFVPPTTGVQTNAAASGFRHIALSHQGRCSPSRARRVSMVTARLHAVDELTPNILASTGEYRFCYPHLLIGFSSGQTALLSMIDYSFVWTNGFEVANKSTATQSLFIGQEGGGVNAASFADFVSDSCVANIDKDYLSMHKDGFTFVPTHKHRFYSAFYSERDAKVHDKSDGEDEGDDVNIEILKHGKFNKEEQSDKKGVLSDLFLLQQQPIPIAATPANFLGCAVDNYETSSQVCEKRDDVDLLRDEDEAKQMGGEDVLGNEEVLEDINQAVDTKIKRRRCLFTPLTRQRKYRKKPLIAIVAESLGIINNSMCK